MKFEPCVKQGFLQFCRKHFSSFAHRIFMPMQPNPGCVDRRFPLYVDELREFFTVSGVPFGTPKDVNSLIESLAKTGSLCGEMSSMVRSIIYRELGTIQKPELQKLVLNAVGGTDAAVALEASENGNVLLNELQGFIDRAYINKPETLRSDETSDIPNADAEKASPAEPYRFHFHSNNPLGIGEANEGMTDGFAEVETSAAVPLKTQTQHLLNDFYYRARSIASVEAETMEEEPSRASSDAGNDQEMPLVVTRTKPRKSRLVLGTVAFILVVFGGILLYHRPNFFESLGADGSRPRRESIVPSAPAYPSSMTGNGGGGTNVFSARSSTVTNTHQTKRKPKAVVTGKSAVPLRHETGRALRPANSQSTKIVTDNGSSASSGDAELSPSPRMLTERAELSTHLKPFGSGGMSYSSGIMSANVVSAVPPKYPKLASLAHVEGPVILQAIVSRDGTVATTRVLSGPRLLRGAAANAVRRWRYRPYVINGEASEVATIVTVDFRLARH